MASNDNYYWYTREAVWELAFKMKIYRPEVIRLYQNEIQFMEGDKIQELSEKYWANVVHPDILVAEIMES